MVSKKQNPPPKPVVEESSDEEEIEEEVEEEIEEDEEEEEQDQGKPQVSSSSVEEGEGEGEEEETDSNNEDEEDQSSVTKRIQPSNQNVKKPSVKRQSTPPPAVVQNSVSEDDETESEGEAEEDAERDLIRSPTVSDYTVKPITAVPMANTKGGGSKPNTKRLYEEANGKGSGNNNGKKAKTGEENDKKGKSGSFPGRIWNEDSEIAVLQGLIDYQKQYGPFRPATDVEIFHNFIKRELFDGVTKNQIGDKLKRAKCKFSQNVKKGKNGQDPTFPKPHEKKLFDLSKQIWGVVIESNGIADKAKVKGDDGKGKKVGNSSSENKKIEDNAKVKSDNSKGKKGDNAGSVLIPSVDVDKEEKQDLEMEDVKDDDQEDFFSKYPTLSKSFDAELGILKENLHLIGNEKAGELEEKWKQLQLEEMNVLAKRFNMMSDQIKVVLDAMKKR